MSLEKNMTDEQLDSLLLRHAGMLTTGDGIRAFAQAVRAAERERCAALCDQHSADHWHDYKDRTSKYRGDTRSEAMSDAAELCAEAIRRTNLLAPTQEQRMTTKPAGASPVERHVRSRAQRPRGYPTELVAKARYEMRVFERVSAETGAELIAEVERLRAEIERHTPNGS